MNKIIEIKQISKVYKNKYALDSLSFSVEQGSICGIIGRNGSGKTTLLSIIADLIKPSEGSVKVDIQQLGACIESPTFYAHLTAKQNLDLIAQIQGKPNNDINDVLELVGLTPQINKKYANLSVGMKQRLGIAGTLIGNKSIIVLDEPTNGLDPLGIIEMRGIIEKMKQLGKTVLIASHLLTEIEQICTDILFLNEGKMIFYGKTSALLNEYVTTNLEEAFLQKIKIR